MDEARQAIVATDVFFDGSEGDSSRTTLSRQASAAHVTGDSASAAISPVPSCAASSCFCGYGYSCGRCVSACARVWLAQSS